MVFIYLIYTISVYENNDILTKLVYKLHNYKVTTIVPVFSTI